MHNAHDHYEGNEAPTKDEPRRALLVYAADSYVGFCQILYDYLILTGTDVSVLEVLDARNSTVLTESQREKWGVNIPQDIITRVKSDELIERVEASDADHIFLGVNGRTVFRICKFLHQQKKADRKPVIITGFPGLQFRLMVEGVILRCFVDRLLFTDPTLMKKSAFFLSFLPFKTAQCILFGSPRLQALPADRESRGRPYVVFFDQNVVPREYDVRVRLAEHILALAKDFPDKTFLIAGRSRSGEMSYHPLAGDTSMDALVAGQNYRNVSPFSGNWTDIHADIHLCFSVSSTAILEAASLGIPAYSIAVEGDIDTRFSAQGFYSRLGLQRTPAELAQEIREPRPDVPTNAAKKHIAPFTKSSLPLLFAPKKVERLPEAPVSVRNVLFRLSKFGDWILSKIR